MSNRKKVLLMVETSLCFGRGVLQGISQYMVSERNWSIWLDMRELLADPPRWFEDWQGDGVILRSATPQVVEMIKRKGVPAIDLTDIFGDLDLPHIWVDHEAVGRMAARHFLERGFRQFAYCGFENHRWSQRRKKGFVSALPAKHECHLFDNPWFSGKDQNWEEQQAALIVWLRKLPKPIAILACNDMRGQHILDACRRAGLAVPEEIAVLGVDNDELICTLCEPPLSSIILNTHKIGFEAARMLDLLMNGEELPAREILVEPIGIMARQSSDVLAIDHIDVAKSLRYIREHACTGLTVDDLLKQCNLTRSVMERLYRKYLGHSPQQEIRLVQIKRVKELLLETEMSLHQIAAVTGFEHSEYLSVMFKRIAGMTPGDYRRSIKTKISSIGQQFTEVPESIP